MISITLNKWLFDIKNLPWTVGLLGLCFSKITHLQNSHVCRLDGIRGTPYWETKKTDRNSVNEQSTCRERCHLKGLIRMTISDPSFFQDKLPYSLPFLCEKSESPLFENVPPHFIKQGGGCVFQLWNYDYEISKLLNFIFVSTAI